jgi:hypothetical protein
VLSQSDLVAHAFELLDEASLVGVLLLAFDKVVAAQFVVWLPTLQEVVNDDKNGMGDCDNGFSVSSGGL